jgi:hypothetical protein
MKAAAIASAHAMVPILIVLIVDSFLPVSGVYRFPAFAGKRNAFAYSLLWTTPGGRL